MKQSLLFVLFLLLLSSLPAQQRFPAGVIFDEDAYETVPLQESLPGLRLSPSHSLRAYAPTPQDQGSYNNCVGWSVAYAARTILLAREKGWTRTDQINSYAFSPSFTYKLVSKDNSCESAVSIEEALYAMTRQGAIFMRDLPTPCIRRLPYNALARAQNYKIDAYKRLFYKDAEAKNRVNSVKQALAQGQPVILGMRCTPSFEQADGEAVWMPQEPSSTRQYYGHALTVVGYDDNRYGGAFELMNSWGTGWGKGGFIWVRYADFASFSKYAYVPIVER